MSIRESNHSPRFRPFAALIMLLLVVVAGRPTFGYTPTDPVVTKMVNQGVSYLEKLSDKDFGGGDPFSAIAGEAVLIGYAHHKCRHDPDSAAVKRALRNAKAVVSALTKGGGRHPRSEPM